MGGHFNETRIERIENTEKKYKNHRAKRLHFKGVISQPKYADSVQKNEKKSFICTEFFLLLSRKNSVGSIKAFLVESMADS